MQVGRGAHPTPILRRPTSTPRSAGHRAPRHPPPQLLVRGVEPLPPRETTGRVATAPLHPGLPPAASSVSSHQCRGVRLAARPRRPQNRQARAEPPPPARAGLRLEVLSQALRTRCQVPSPTDGRNYGGAGQHRRPSRLDVAKNLVTLPVCTATLNVSRSLAARASSAAQSPARTSTSAIAAKS